MEAHHIRLAVILLALGSVGAEYRTPNFVVQAPSGEIAKQVALKAEQSRKQIARDWLGKTLPQWYKPCRVTVKTGRMGAGGATSFQFDRGHVYGWRMRVQGSLERVLDSVIPHEVSHTIFASHFRRPLPRWADEGAATLVEHESEQRRQRLLLKQVLNTSQRIPVSRLLSMTEYPRNSRQVLVLYAEGYSLADFLVQSGGRSQFLQFLQDGHQHGWNAAIRQHYPFEGVEELERQWNGWVMAGSPRLDLPEGTQLADATDSQTGPPEPPDSDLVVRSQSPDESDEPQQGPSSNDRPGNTSNLNEDWEPIPLPQRSKQVAATQEESLPRQGLIHPVLTVPSGRSLENTGEQQPTLPATSLSPERVD